MLPAKAGLTSPEPASASAEAEAVQGAYVPSQLFASRCGTRDPISGWLHRVAVSPE